MSTYDVDLTIGGVTFNLSSGDAPDAGLNVLAGLSLGWQFPSNAAWPAQPDPVTCKLGLISDDVTLYDLGTIDINAAVYVRITSAGTLVASFAGRVADMNATPDRYNGAQVMRYDLIAVDYVVDLAETLITVNQASESIGFRIQALAAAAEAKGSAPFVFPAHMESFYALLALDAFEQPASDLIDDVLKQVSGLDMDDPNGRTMILPQTIGGVLDSYDLTHTVPSYALTWPPAILAVVAGELTIVPDDTPPVTFVDYALGLAIDADRVDEDLTFNRTKSASPNYVTVTYGAGGVLSVSVTDVPSAATPKVKLPLASQLTTSAAATSMAGMYLPDGDANRWAADRFTWRPSDAELAALPFPLTPDTEDLGLSGPPCYLAQVMVSTIPDNINPAGNAGIYAGVIDGAEVRIMPKRGTDAGGEVVVELKLRKRLPRPPAAFAVTYDEVKADFPGVEYSIGAEVVDPGVTYYETRLVRTH